MIIECSECRQYVDAKETGSYWRHINGGEASSRRYTLLGCAGCGNPILVRQSHIGNSADDDKWDTASVIFPQNSTRVNPNAPVHIRAAYEEASSCFRSQAYTASAIMCCKTLEGVCAAHGVTERNLSASLLKMKDEGLIDERLYEWGSSLRAIGNEAAPGMGSTIGPTDAKDTLEFTNGFLDYMFSYRDRFEQFKRRRNNA